MKKVFFWVMALCFCLPLQLNAQSLFPQFSKMVKHYYPGILYYNDGHSEEFRWVELPKGGDKNITVSNDEKKKDKVKVPSADLHHMLIWSQQQPDSIFALHHIQVKASKKLVYDMWGIRTAASAWGMTVSVYSFYEINKKKGILIGYVESTNNFRNPLITYLSCTGEKYAKPLMADGAIMSPKKTCEYFKDKPDVANAIKSKQLKGSDIQYILDEMAVGLVPDKDEKKDNTRPSQATIEAAENGVVGDDE